MWERVKGFVSAHPWGTAAIVFVVGIVLIYWFRGSGGSGAQPAVSNLGPYYNAQAASQAAGASVYDAQISANAATSIAATNADRDLKIAAISAGVANNRIGSDTTLGTLQLANALTLGSEQVDATVKLGSQATDRAVAASHDAYWAHRSDNETAVAINTSNNGVTSLHDTLAAQTTQQGQTLAADVARAHDANQLAGAEFAGTIDAYRLGLSTRLSMWNGLLQFETANPGVSSPIADIASYTPLPDPTSLGISAARYGAASSGATNTNPNAGYPQNLQSAGFAAYAAPAQTPATVVDKMAAFFGKAA